jgi:hypothetical protein
MNNGSGLQILYTNTNQLERHEINQKNIFMTRNNITYKAEHKLDSVKKCLYMDGWIYVYIYMCMYRYLCICIYIYDYKYMCIFLSYISGTLT